MNGFHAGVLAILVASASAQEHSLDDRRFESLRLELTADDDAQWRTIPWRIDLLAAQREAAAQQKPLFVWAMDGHPLGCV